MRDSQYIRFLPSMFRLGLFMDPNTSRVHVLSLGYINFTWLAVISSILLTMDYHGTKLPIRAIYELLHFSGTLCMTTFIIAARKDLTTLVRLLSRPFYDFKTGSPLRDEILKSYQKQINRTGKFFVFYLFLFLSCFLLSLSPLLTLPYYCDDTPVNNLPLPVGAIPFHTDSYFVYAFAYAISACAMCGEGVFNSTWLMILSMCTHKIKAQLQLLVDAIDHLEEKSMSRALEDDERDEAFLRALDRGEDQLTSDARETVTVHQQPDETCAQTSGCSTSTNTMWPGTCTLNRHAVWHFKIQTKLPQEEMDCLIECVDSHTEIMEFVGLFKACFKYALLFSFEVTAMVISVTFLQIFQMDGSDSWEILIAIHVILTCVLVLWVFTRIGQSIINECENLRFALYNLNWIGKPKGLVSSLRIMMTVSTRPMLLSVGNLYPLSMETFGKILSAAYTYINLLYSIQKKEKHYFG